MTVCWIENRRSARQAKERLKLVLIHDRTDLSPGELEALKDDLIEVISRHIEIDPRRCASRWRRKGASSA